MHPNCFPSIEGSDNGICKHDVRFHKAMVSFQISSGNNFKTMTYKTINIFLIWHKLPLKESVKEEIEMFLSDVKISASLYRWLFEKIYLFGFMPLFIC